MLFLKSMKYYPVYIPTLNRFEHFKQCVESLACNTHADQTELVIGLDYPPSDKYVEGYEKIKAYIPLIQGFKKVTVFEWDENLGQSENCRRILRYLFDHYDAAISTEDDLVFSPCFLDFMNKALNIYKDDPQVATVCGYIGENYYGQFDKHLIFNFDNCGWGMGIWKHKEQNRWKKRNDDINMIFKSIKCSVKVLSVSPGIFSMFLAMIRLGQRWGDVLCSAQNIINNLYQLCPTISLVRNNGYDGTGVHCGDSDPLNLAQQKISDELLFNYDMKDVISTSDPIVRKLLFLQGLPKGFFMRGKVILSIIIRYIILRLNFCFSRSSGILLTDGPSSNE